MSATELPAELEALVRRHPLPGGFRVTECLAERTTVPGLEVEAVGLVASSLDGRSAWGSAGERGVPPFERAFYELVERVTVLEASRSAGPLIFPPAPQDASYAYSRSSGVAAGPNFAAACRAARAELIERDRFLRSWYGETVPELIELSNDSAWEALAPFYDLRAYAFPGQPNVPHDFEVVSVFGFPKVERAPLVFGFGADASRERALRRAANETLQRWAFLWGEAIPERAPEFSTTADYHQEFYLWPAMHGRLRAWLSGSHAERAPAIERRRPEPDVPEFVELGSTSELSVARALPRSELPLVFGCGHPDAPRHEHEPYLVHPFV